MISSLESRLLRVKVIAASLIGVFLGAVGGGLVFAGLSAEKTATAFLRLQDPADLAAIAGGANQVTPYNQDNTSTFVAGEIAYLSGDGFTQAVSRRMAMDEPAKLDIAQAGESAMVSISSGGSSDDEAIRTVQTAIDLYREELEQRVDEQLRLILPSLSQWQQQNSADATRIQELQRLREGIELQATRAASVVVVQPPVPESAASSPWIFGIVAGASLGGLASAGLVLARRRRAGRGSTVSTTTAIVDGVLLPPVNLDMPPRDTWGEEQIRLARTLYAQIPSAGPRVIVVAGASASSGNAVIASLLEFAAVESRPAPTALTTRDEHSPTASGPVPTQVIAVGRVADAMMAPEIASTVTHFVLVARLESDSVDDVLALRSATTSSAASAVAAFTYRRSGWSGLRRRRPSGDDRSSL